MELFERSRVVNSRKLDNYNDNQDFISKHTSHISSCAINSTRLFDILRFVNAVADDIPFIDLMRF